MLFWFILHTNPGHCFRNEDIASTVWARISSSYYVLNHQFVWCEIINLWTVCRSRLDWRSTITDKIKSHVVYSIAMYYKHTNLKYKGNLIKPNFEQPMLWTRISSPNSRSGRISVRDERQESDGEAELCVVVKLFDAEWLLSKPICILDAGGLTNGSLTHVFEIFHAHLFEKPSTYHACLRSLSVKD